MPVKIKMIRKTVTKAVDCSLVFKKAPNFAPIQAPGTSNTAYNQRTFPNATCVTELTIADKKIINIDVATATCGGNANNKIIAGTISAPPPMPKIPEQNPTIKAIQIAVPG